MTQRTAHRFAWRSTVLLLLAFTCAPTLACTVSGGTASLGSQTSVAIESTAAGPVQANSGLVCEPALLGVGTPVHIRADIATGLPGGTGTLTGPDGLTVNFQVRRNVGDPALQNGNQVIFVSTTQLVGGLLWLFSGPGGSVPLYVSAGPGTALKQGIYEGSFALRWYYYNCTDLGILGACLGTLLRSPGFTVNVLGGVSNWGTGTLATVNVSLEITRDCLIDAPDLDFGDAPLASAFDPVTQTLYIRCTRDITYQVGIGDGMHSAAGQRRMHQGGQHLAYEIHKSQTNDRWGSVGAQRRASTGADLNGANHNGLVQQGFQYRATVLPGQPTPPPGIYTDTLQVVVEF